MFNIRGKSRLRQNKQKSNIGQLLRIFNSLAIYFFSFWLCLLITVHIYIQNNDHCTKRALFCNFSITLTSYCWGEWMWITRTELCLAGGHRTPGLLTSDWPAAARPLAASFSCSPPIGQWLSLLHAHWSVNRSYEVTMNHPRNKNCRNKSRDKGHLTPADATLILRCSRCNSTLASAIVMTGAGIVASFQMNDSQERRVFGKTINLWPHPWPPHLMSPMVSVRPGDMTHSTQHPGLTRGRGGKLTWVMSLTAPKLQDYQNWPRERDEKPILH